MILIRILKINLHSLIHFTIVFWIMKHIIKNHHRLASSILSSAIIIVIVVVVITIETNIESTHLYYIFTKTTQTPPHFLTSLHLKFLHFFTSSSLLFICYFASLHFTSCEQQMHCYCRVLGLHP